MQLQLRKRRRRNGLGEPASIGASLHLLLSGLQPAVFPGVGRDAVAAWRGDDAVAQLIVEL